MARGKDYDEYDAKVRVPKGTTLDQSRKTSGAHRATARDADGNLVAQAELLLQKDPPKERSDSSPSRLVSDPGRQNVEAAGESAPDISQLVPIALVAVAGIAAGVAGVKIAQNRKRRRAEERMSVAAPTGTPAGWYEFDDTRLRYWNSVAWTEEYAQRASSAPSIAADWYPDPSNAAQLRYWDGSAWTHHTSPRPGVVATPADWYPDPSNAGQLRYWDGNAWTNHVTSGPGASVAVQPTATPSNSRDLAPAHDVPQSDMTTAEWRAHVEAWARAGAIQQELWSRLTNARITDGDDATLAAQRQWEQLTPQEGARRIQLMLEANPALRDQSVLLEFVRLYGGGHAIPQAFEGKHV